jgi:hypothetical protein
MAQQKTPQIMARPVNIPTHMPILNGRLALAPILNRVTLAPEEGCSVMSPQDGMERLNEFPFVLFQEEVVQDPDGRRQVVVNNHNPAYWYFQRAISELLWINVILSSSILCSLQ